jgi:hypothetical protein
VRTSPTPSRGSLTSGCLLLAAAILMSLFAAPGARADKWSQTPALSATVMAGSSPSAHLNTEGNLRIFYPHAATGHQVRMLVWNKGLSPEWADQSLVTTTEAAAGSSPTSFPWPDGGVRSYYVEAGTGTTRRIREMNYTAGSAPVLNSALNQTTDVAAGTSPSAARNSEGNIRIYFVSASDGKIHQLAWNAGLGWAPETGALSTQQVATGTSPSHFATWSNAGSRTYYVGKDDNKIHELSYEASTGWVDTVPVPDAQTVAPGTSPTAHINSEGNIRIYYVDAEHKLHQVARNAGASPVWSDALPANDLALADVTPSAIASPNGGVRVYVVGAADKAIHEISYDGVPGWADSGAISWPIADSTSPSAALNLDGQPRVTFVAKADNKLHELVYDDKPGWNETAALTTGPVANGNTPSLHVNSEGNLRTYFGSLAGATTELRQLVWNRGLSPEWADQGTTPNAMTAATSASSFAWDNGGVRAYFVGSDGFLHELSAGPSPFNVSPALSGNIEPGTSPAAGRNTEGNVRVYIVSAADHKIHEVAWNAGHSPEWAPQTGALSTYAVASGSSPSLVSSPNGGVRLYYVASGGALRQISYDAANGWHDIATPTAQVASGTSPSAHMNTEGDYRITYVAASNHKLRMLTNNAGQWGNDTELPTSEMVASGSNPATVATRYGGYRAYFFADSDKGLREVSYDAGNGGWKASDALTPPVAASTDPTVARCRYMRVCVQYVGAADKRIYQTANDAGSGWLSQMVTDFDAVPLADAKNVKSPLPLEQTQFVTALRGRTQDGDMVYNVDDGNAYISYQGTLHQVPQSTADTLGFSLTSGRRTTSAALATSTIGSPVGPTDWQCGGLDHVVNTTGDRSCVVGKVDAAESNGAAYQVILGITASGNNRNDAELALLARVNDGDLATNVVTGEVLLYTNGQWRYLPSDAAIAVGANLGSAKRITTYGVNQHGFGPQIGPYKTSWDYGGADRVVTGGSERASLALLMSQASDPGPLWSGLSSSEQDHLFDGGTVNVVDDSLTAGAMNMPDPVEYGLLGAPAEGATIAALQYGCRPVSLKKKVVWRYDASPDVLIGDATMNTSFCWNQRDHRAVWESKKGILDIKPHVNGLSTLAQWNMAEEDPHYHYQEASPGGWPYGQAHMELGLHVWRSVAGYNVQESHRRMIVLGGWDATWRDASTGF